MSRVVLQDFAANGLQNLIQSNIFLDRFLLGVMGNANVLGCSLRTQAPQYDFGIGGIHPSRGTKLHKSFFIARALYQEEQICADFRHPSDMTVSVFSGSS